MSLQCERCYEVSGDYVYRPATDGGDKLRLCGHCAAEYDECREEEKDPLDELEAIGASPYLTKPIRTEAEARRDLANATARAVAILTGAPVYHVGDLCRQRDGHTVRVVAVTVHPGSPIIVQAACGAVTAYDEFGRYGEAESPLDLVEIVRAK